VSSQTSDLKIMKEKIVKILIQKGEELLNKPKNREGVDFFLGIDNKKIKDETKKAANKLLNNFTEYPHAFVLACVMDKQMKAERSWLIPLAISEEIRGFYFQKLFLMKLEKIKEIFKRRNLARFYNKRAEEFHLTIKKIHDDYKGNASNIWKNKPKSGEIIIRFLQFYGVGPKIATMAVNILARDFKITMQDFHCIDISPDIHVKRVFKRLGLVSNNASNDELIYRARVLNPEYPGVFDLPCWEIGRTWCRPKNLKCHECYLDKYCPKNI